VHDGIEVVQKIQDVKEQAPQRKCFLRLGWAFFPRSSSNHQTAKSPEHGYLMDPPMMKPQTKGEEEHREECHTDYPVVLLRFEQHSLES